MAKRFPPAMCLLGLLACGEPKTVGAPPREPIPPTVATSATPSPAASTTVVPKLAVEPWKVPWIDVFEGSVEAFQDKAAGLEVAFFDLGPAGIGGRGDFWPGTPGRRRARIEQCARVEAPKDDTRGWLRCHWLDPNWLGDVTFILEGDQLLINMAAVTPEGRRALPPLKIRRRPQTP